MVPDRVGYLVCFLVEDPLSFFEVASDIFLILWLRLNEQGWPNSPLTIP